MTAVAKRLGVSTVTVYRVSKAFLLGGEEAVQRLSWARGRPSKCMFLTQQQLDFMVSRSTLTRQIGLSLRARALQFSVRWTKKISAT